MKYNFYMSLRTQYENLGDYLIAQATIDILKDIGEVTLDIRKVPKNYINLFEFPKNIKLTEEGFLTTLLKNKNKNWFYVIKPGGYSTATTLKAKSRLILMFLYFFICKLFFKVKLIKMPHSYLGKLNFIEKIYQRLFDSNIVRDEISVENYKKCNCKEIILIEDLATFYFNKKSKFLSQKNQKKENIVISLRYDRLDNENNFSYKIANFLLKEENLKDIIYVSQVTFDNDLNQINSNLNNKEIIKYNIDNSSLKTIIDTYRNSKYIISNRLHALLLAKINGTTPIALVDVEKDKKIIGALNLLKINWIDKNTKDYKSAVDNIKRNRTTDHYNPNLLLNSLHGILNDSNEQF